MRGKNIDRTIEMERQERKKERRRKKEGRKERKKEGNRLRGDDNLTG